VLPGAPKGDQAVDVEPPRGRRALVVENDPTDDARRLGDWLADAGLELVVSRPYAGDELPADLDGFAALVVLGGEQDAFPDASGQLASPWFGPLQSLMRKATRAKVPTLAICLGAQLLAEAHGGTVERSPSGPEIGAKLVARRDVAERDPVFAEVPFAPDVVQWHQDEITELPYGAVLLAASNTYPVQAYRIGPSAWGVQFHIECDTEMFADWAIGAVATLVELGLDGVELVAGVDAVMGEVEEVWRPFAARFAAVALGTLPVREGEPRSLPLLS
jgi:GMP synthase-like glutamine amidotransferase